MNKSEMPKGTTAPEVSSRSEPSLDRVRRAAELLEQEPSPGLADVAKELGVSCSYLRHILSEFLGQSPAHYVKMVRLHRSRELFRHSFLSVKEIMWRVGLRDISHFLRDYKAVFGETPSQTRQHGLSARQ